jgi:HlyD family secretion protein
MKTAFVILAAIALAVGGAAYYSTRGAAAPTTRFRTATVTRDNLLSTISATGTVEPEEVVDVGAQVAGRIKSFGIDPGDPQKKKTIDFGSEVHDGTVLAQIDDALYRAQLNQAAATLQRAKADLLQYQAKCLQAEQEWKRAQSLFPKHAIADTDYDLASANYKAAQANVAVGEATIQQGEATLDLAKTNLDYTVIKSPVEGKIIARRVNIGQTVVAALNAPSMFLIGKDLRRIQVWASVNEADIGRIRIDMPVRFTVDAFPGEVFQGRVAQIRLNASMTQNVVTYTVVVATDNSDGRLLPYLTANLQFEVQELPNVLLVPNAALRWKPRQEQIVPEERGTQTASNDKDKDSSRGAASADKPAAKPAALSKKPDTSGRLWVVVAGFVRPVAVNVGPSDGSMTQVIGDGVKEGMEVVIGEGGKDNVADAETTNPFAPKLFGGKKKM